MFFRYVTELLEYGWQPILDNVDFNTQKKLYNSISQSTFEEIWMFGKDIYPETGLVLKGLGSKYNGNYQKFVAELRKNNKELKDYAEKSAGFFPPKNEDSKSERIFR